MPGSVHDIHSRLGDGRAFGLPVDSLRWRREELEEYRDFVARQLSLQIDDRHGVHTWPTFCGPAAALSSFEEDFNALLEDRDALLQDYFRVKDVGLRVAHEKVEVHAEIESFTNPTVPLLRHRLSVLADLLAEEVGPPELQDDEVPWHGDWVRRVGKSESLKNFLRHGRASFLSRLPRLGDAGFDLVLPDSVATALTVEFANKTNKNRLRLHLAAREPVEFSNTRRARAILARIRGVVLRLLTFALAGQVRVICRRPTDGSVFGAQVLGVLAQSASQDNEAWVVEGGYASRASRVLASYPAQGTIPLLGDKHPCVVAARRLLLSRRYLAPVVCDLDLGGCLFYKRLDHPRPDVAGVHDEVSDEEARYLEAFERDGKQWWRVWTFDCFRDYPVAEFSNRLAAIRFLKANCTISGIRVGMSLGRSATERDGSSVRPASG